MTFSTGFPFSHGNRRMGEGEAADDAVIVVMIEGVFPGS